jgi:hypothetical protein
MLYLNLVHVISRQLFLFFLSTSTLTVGYNIQFTATSVFSLLVKTIIPDINILEFILWTINLRKQIKLYTNLNYNMYQLKLQRILIKNIIHTN